MSNNWHIVRALVGFFIFLFVYWRVLKEEIDKESVFKTGLMFSSLVLVGAIAPQIIFGFLTKTVIFDPRGLWFYGSLIFGIIGIYLVSRLSKIKILEILETVTPGFIIFLLLLTVEFSYTFISLVIFLLVKRSYKRFHWYKSGKIGLASLFAWSFLFLTRALVGVLNQSFLNTTGIGKVDIVVSFAVAFILFWTVYYLKDLN